jgi:hypothetical protein
MKPRTAIVLPLPLTIFLLARVPILLALPFDGLRGYGDLLNFFNIAAIPGLPFLNHWVEFPPGFAFFNKLLYVIAGGVEHTYTYIFVLILLAADIGNVLLFLRIEKLVYPQEVSPSWRSLIYAAIIAGLPYAWWYFDSLAVFFTMLSLYLFFSKRSSLLTGVSIGVGILTKLFPALLLPALVRSQPPRRSITITVTALALFVLPILGLYAISPQFTRATLASQSARGSVATVWALIDGNYRAGGFGALSDRLDPAKAYISTRKSAVVPQYWLLLAFSAAGLYLFARARLDTPLKILGFYGATLVMFFLWSSGWSPQWVQHLIPIALLTLPMSPGVLLLVVMVLVNLLEWPLLLSRGLFYTLPLTVILREFLMILLGVLFYRQTR